MLENEERKNGLNESREEHTEYNQTENAASGEYTAGAGNTKAAENTAAVGNTAFTGSAAAAENTDGAGSTASTGNTAAAGYAGSAEGMAQTGQAADTGSGEHGWVNAQEKPKYSYQTSADQGSAGAGSNPAGAPPKKTKKKSGNAKAYGRTAICAVIFGAIVGGMVIGSYAIGKNAVQSFATAQTTETRLSTAASDDSNGSADATATSTSADGTYTVSEISEQCKSSVVAITNKSVSEVQTIFGTMQQESTGSGSGVIIGQNDTELLIATNNHVVSDAEQLSVCFNDSEDSVYSAVIKGTDSSNDLAVIAVKLADMTEDDLNSISIATIGDSTELAEGDQVVAIGNALGLGQSVTTGIVSALEREVTIDDVTTTLLQTDAAINPGNSGGALFNMKGELIGINTAKYSSEDVEGMGFAIPMSKAQSILEDLMNRETREKLESGYGYIGVYGTDVSDEAQSYYGIPAGAYVSEVVEGGAADNAGIQAGDIITGFDGSTVTSFTALKELMQYYAAGEKVEVTIERNTNGSYEEQTLTLTLGSSEDAQTSGSSQSQDSQSQSGQSDQSRDSQSQMPGSGSSDSFSLPNGQ